MTGSTNKTPATKRPRRMAREPKLHDVREPHSDGIQVKEPAARASASKAPTKITLILDLLSQPQGATLDQIVEATGWLPHTTRAALTGLKKKGNEVTSARVDGVRTYRVTKPQVELAKLSDEAEGKSEA